MALKVEHAKRPGIWGRAHYLDRMTLRELAVAFFQYYAIQGYILMTLLCAVFVWFNPPGLWQGIAAALAAVILYPLVWYALHRWVLHGQLLYKSPLTAKVWKRIHYDHHQDPNHLEILFGALYTTLPTIAIVTIPVGWLIGGPGAGAVAFAAGLITTCVYEFFPCIQHLSYKPKAKWLMEMKQRHMEHHFHDEDGNYGITSFWPDKLFGSYYHRKERTERSPTVFNLGYTDLVARKFPWVARASGGVATGHPRERLKRQQEADKDAQASFDNVA